MIVENGEDSYMMDDTKKFLPDGSDFNNNNIVTKAAKKFSGLSKEEVLAYSTDPAWVKLRWILFIIFWLIWLGLLGSVIGIVIMTPKCAPKPNLDWWQKEIVYQVDVQKFMDSDSNGVGDLNGLVDKIQYFKDLGVEAICLRSNVLSSDEPKKFGPGMLNEMSLKDLKKKFKMNDIHLILDLPYAVVVKDDSVLEYWLQELADGIRIADSNMSYVDDESYKKLLPQWMEIVDRVGDQTFEKKFLSFQLPPKEIPLESIPSVLQRGLYTSNVFDSNPSAKQFLKEWQQAYKKGSAINFGLTLGDSENRLARLRESIIDRKQLHVAHGIALLLKGTPFVLYGDELEFDSQSPPMKWNNMLNCGFSKNASLELNNCQNSVQDSFAHGSGQNLIRMYKQLSKLRKEPSFAWGRIEIETENVKSIVSFVREAEGFDGYLVAANFDGDSFIYFDSQVEESRHAASSNFAMLHEIPKNGTVAYFYSDSDSSRNEFRSGLEVFTDRILLKRGELLVVKFDKRPRNEF